MKKKKEKIILIVLSSITFILVVVAIILVMNKTDKKNEKGNDKGSNISSEISTEESSMLDERETLSLGKNYSYFRIYDMEEIVNEYNNYFVKYNKNTQYNCFKILEGTLTSSKYNVSGITGEISEHVENWDEDTGYIFALNTEGKIYVAMPSYNDGDAKKDADFTLLETSIEVIRLIGPYFYGVADGTYPISNVYAQGSDNTIYNISYDLEKEKYTLEKSDDSIFSFSNLAGKISKNNNISLYMNSSKGYRKILDFELKELIETSESLYYAISKDDYLYKIVIEDEDSSLDSSFELVSDSKIEEITGYTKVGDDDDDEVSDGYKIEKEIKFTFEK